MIHNTSSLKKKLVIWQLQNLNHLSHLFSLKLLSTFTLNDITKNTSLDFFHASHNFIQAYSITQNSKEFKFKYLRKY